MTRMLDYTVQRVGTKILVPYILLYALYVQFHGDFGPGGGFQAGVIFAAAIILYAMMFGLRATQRVVSPGVLRTLVALGVLIYGGVGVATMLLGGKFLDYNVLGHDHSPEGISIHGQHLGILLVELGVGITVASAMVMLFYCFAGRRSL